MRCTDCTEPTFTLTERKTMRFRTNVASSSGRDTERGWIPLGINNERQANGTTESVIIQAASSR